MFWLTKGLGFIGTALAGAGHGSDVLGLLFLSPTYHSHDDVWILFGPYIWAIIAGLMLWTSQKWVCVSIIVMTGISYVGASFDIISDLRETGTPVYLIRTIQDMPMIAMPLIIVYLVMQVVVYWRIVKSLRKSVREK
jgi:hypothetical protein